MCKQSNFSELKKKMQYVKVIVSVQCITKLQNHFDFENYKKKKKKSNHNLNS